MFDEVEGKRACNAFFVVVVVGQNNLLYNTY